MGVKPKRVRDKKLMLSYTVKYQRTPRGYVLKIYSKMKSRVNGTNAKSREYPHLWQGKALLPKEVFLKWSLEDEAFNRLFVEWVASGFNKERSPSINRISSGDGYEIGNIEWVTKNENSRLAASKSKVRRWKVRPKLC